MKTLILDSSVIAKWFFYDEGDVNASKIKELFVANEVSLAAPLLLYYEMNNLLKTAIKVHRIEKANAIDVYRTFLQLNIVIYSSANLLTETLSIACLYDISSYDASYIALAEELEIPFITADQKLINKIDSKYIFNIDDLDKVL